jgi:predicted secreted hydrolase
MRRSAWALLGALAICVGAVATASDDGATVAYPPVTPGTVLEFPRDEGSHPQYRLEWWYVTGWLEDAAGAPLGFQVTFFRVRSGLGESNPSRFAPRQVLFAHAAIAEPAHGRLRHAERSAREGFGLAYAREGGADVRIDDWTLRRQGEQFATTVVGADFSVDLTMRVTQPPLLQGDGGYSRKGAAPNAASYYYSLPQLEVGGSIDVEGRRRDVTGHAWFDHEWSSEVMDPAATGWDWLGINLDDGGALMAFRMRGRDGTVLWAAATRRSRDGRVETLPPEAVAWTPVAHWRSPRTGASYPVRWRLTTGSQSYRVEPLMDDAELDSRASTGAVYWEGPVTLRSEAGEPLGQGYLELTGYASPLDL